MSASENQSTEKLAKDFTRTWRYKVGLFMIIAGHLVLLLAFVLPFLGVSAAFVGAAVMGGWPRTPLHWHCGIVYQRADNLHPDVLRLDCI
jgi:hypothetical protein